MHYYIISHSPLPIFKNQKSEEKIENIRLDQFKFGFLSHQCHTQIYSVV